MTDRRRAGLARWALAALTVLALCAGLLLADPGAGGGAGCRVVAAAPSGHAGHARGGGGLPTGATDGVLAWPVPGVPAHVAIGGGRLWWSEDRGTDAVVRHVEPDRLCAEGTAAVATTEVPALVDDLAATPTAVWFIAGGRLWRLAPPGVVQSVELDAVFAAHAPTAVVASGARVWVATSGHVLELAEDGEVSSAWPVLAEPPVALAAGRGVVHTVTAVERQPGSGPAPTATDLERWPSPGPEADGWVVQGAAVDAPLRYAAVADGGSWYAGLRGALWRWPDDGATHEVAAPAAGPLATVGQDVLVADYDGGQVVRVSPDGTVVDVVVLGRPPLGLALDAAAPGLLWATAGRAPSDDGDGVGGFVVLAPVG